MRRPLFIAMIFLLLLRGWMGDAMATGMAAGYLQRLAPAAEFMAADGLASGAGAHLDHDVASAPAESMVHSAATPPDCAGHASAQSSAPEAAGHCESCAACQACHTVALSPVTASTTSLTLSPVLSHSPAARFASAVATLGEKPPIS